MFLRERSTRILPPTHICTHAHACFFVCFFPPFFFFFSVFLLFLHFSPFPLHFFGYCLCFHSFTHPRPRFPCGYLPVSLYQFVYPTYPLWPLLIIVLFYYTPLGPKWRISNFICGAFVFKLRKLFFTLLQELIMWNCFLKVWNLNLYACVHLYVIRCLDILESKNRIWTCVPFFVVVLHG